MTQTYDVVIIGGAVIGSSVAYFLAANPDFDGSVLVIERDSSYAQSATALSASGIRTQFSNAINVQISQFGAEFIRQFPDLMQIGPDRPDLNFHPGGYLFLARNTAQAEILIANHKVQLSCGADVVLWNSDELAAAFPHLNTSDITLASYGRRDEGWFDNTGMMNGFRNKARDLGVEYTNDTAVAIGHENGRANTVTLASGQIVNAGIIVNASGPRAALTARMAGLDLPVEPRKRTAFVFDCAHSPEGSATINQGRLPLMIDPSGIWVRPEGRYFLTAAPPAEDPAVDWDDYQPRYEEFENTIWPVLAARSSNFEAIKVVNQWAGHYDYNTLDHNMIIGRHPEMPNFICANGFSGHGLQQAPATGRAVSELIAYGRYRTLDLSPLCVERIIENRPFLEQAVI